MKLLILLTFITFTAMAENNQSQCESLIKQIDEIHIKQMGYTPFSGDYENVPLKDIIVNRKVMHDEMYIPSQSDPSVLPEGETTETIRERLDSFDDTIQQVMAQDEFQRLSRINKYLSAEFVRSCQESDIRSGETELTFDDVNCFADGYRFGRFENVKEFGEDVMNAIVHYMTDVEQQTNFPLATVIQDCQALAANNASVDGCSLIMQNVVSDDDSDDVGRVVAGTGSGSNTRGPQRPNEERDTLECSEGQEVYNGSCRQKCTHLEVRDLNNPTQCLPDVAAQREDNLRRQESKRKWGKVLRTGATVALIGGGLLLGAWAVKSLFFDDDNRSYNSGYQAGLSAGGGSRGYYYPTLNGGGSYPYVIPSRFGGGMGHNGMPAWGGFNPYMNYNYPQYQPANDFSNYSFSF